MEYINISDFITLESGLTCTDYIIKKMGKLIFIERMKITGVSVSTSEIGNTKIIGKLKSPYTFKNSIRVLGSFGGWNNINSIIFLDNKVMSFVTTNSGTNIDLFVFNVTLVID